jgi:hypothetical protein
LGGWLLVKANLQPKKPCLWRLQSAASTWRSKLDALIVRDRRGVVNSSNLPASRVGALVSPFDRDK